MTDPKEIGISSAFITDGKFEGKLFTERKDFIVQEIGLDGKTLSIENSGESSEEMGKQKSFLAATLVKDGLSTHEALSILSRENNLNIRRIGYLGNKDRNAVTSQRLSFFKVMPNRLKKEYRKMFLKDLQYSDTGCKIGELQGNHFIVRIREFKGFERLDSFISEVVNKGVPNFYGPQHFGASALNIQISKDILSKDFKAAVDKYLFAERSESSAFAENRLILAQKFRNRVIGDSEQHDDTSSGVDSFLGMRTERDMIQHLIANKHDYIGALRIIPKYLRLLILQSFQSYVFNLSISESIKKDSLKEYLPTIGYDMENNGADKDAQGLVMSVMQSQGISDPTALRIKEMPEVSLKSFIRPSKTYPKNVSYVREYDDLVLSFDLDKGAYATIFLFEMFKRF
ncbi:MAG: tRNA pseudouridine(13) synthase TruD [Candidatus Parvarchaeota archaeon]|nr:tRNA pseudouridine(13) synthase TruD [Candidatus Parvarchaeota archaeon]